MKNNVIIKNISEISQVNTIHKVGKKKVFIKREECQSNLMQAAYGFLISGEIVEEHFHPTMEEFYFFESGEAMFFVDNKQILCKRGTFIMIPVNTKHFLSAISDTTFIYWGVKV